MCRYLNGGLECKSLSVKKLHAITINIEVTYQDISYFLEPEGL